MEHYSPAHLAGGVAGGWPGAGAGDQGAPAGYHLVTHIDPATSQNYNSR